MVQKKTHDPQGGAGRVDPGGAAAGQVARRPSLNNGEMTRLKGRGY